MSHLGLRPWLGWVRGTVGELSSRTRRGEAREPAAAAGADPLYFALGSGTARPRGTADSPRAEGAGTKGRPRPPGRPLSGESSGWVTALPCGWVEALPLFKRLPCLSPVGC